MALYCCIGCTEFQLGAAGFFSWWLGHRMKTTSPISFWHQSTKIMALLTDQEPSRGLCYVPTSPHVWNPVSQHSYPSIMGIFGCQEPEAKHWACPMNPSVSTYGSQSAKTNVMAIFDLPGARSLVGACPMDPPVLTYGIQSAKSLTQCDGQFG